MSTGPAPSQRLWVSHRPHRPPSTGRSGSASLMARALLSRDGATTVEVSTATLDTATLAPGNISKLQIKLLDSQGRVRGVQNHVKLSSGGRVQRVLTGLGRGQPLQLQANVEGIDGARMDVVTVGTPVQPVVDQPYTCTRNNPSGSYSSWVCRGLDRTTEFARGSFVSSTP